MITGNVIGGRIKNPDTIIMVDEYGNEYTTAMSGEEVELTATTNDLRLGKVAALETGIKTGEKLIPAYHTQEGHRIIMPGRSFSLNLTDCNYEKLQSLLCKFNTSITDSVATDRVSIADKVYNVNSTTSISTIIVDNANNSINWGISNESDEPYILRYFTYKEI